MAPSDSNAPTPLNASQHDDVPRHGDQQGPGIAPRVHEAECENEHLDKRQSCTVCLAHLATKDFWIVLALGQVLSLCITSTNTLSGVLASAGVSIPAFQILPNYALLCLLYTTISLYHYGATEYARILFKDGWRYLLLSLLDVEGNYFVVLAYRYTTILQAQLINIWAIVIVVAVSSIFLKVRYARTQYFGILVAVSGLCTLIASDHITGANGVGGNEYLKGDLFALLGATIYGLSNVFEESLVSKRPLHAVLGQLGLWGTLISGAQTAVFDRAQWREAEWTVEVGGYLTGFTLTLVLFYTLVPLLFRLSGAAFFNISLLTANFWGVCIGVGLFGYNIHYLYPVAFVLILLGLIMYFTSDGVIENAKQPWLDSNQGRSGGGIRAVTTLAGEAEERDDTRRPLLNGTPRPRAV